MASEWLSAAILGCYLTSNTLAFPNAVFMGFSIPASAGELDALVSTVRYLSFIFIFLEMLSYLHFSTYINRYRFDIVIVVTVGVKYSRKTFV